MLQYNVLLDDIDTVEKAISINENTPEKMIKYSMLFLMRKGVTPLWEDPRNKQGGCFSYKVVNKYVEQVWREMFYLACGESLGLNDSYSSHINGITISPKKNFCIIKIWLQDQNHQDPNMIQTIEHLTKTGLYLKCMVKVQIMDKNMISLYVGEIIFCFLIKKDPEFVPATTT